MTDMMSGSGLNDLNASLPDATERQPSGLEPPSSVLARIGSGSGSKGGSGNKPDTRGSNAASVAVQEGENLCVFWIADECYALDVAYVSEAITFPAVRPVPSTPKELLGMVNLRGTALAVLDLAGVLALPRSDRHQPAERDSLTVLILSPSLLYAGLRIGRVDSVVPYQLEQVCKVNERADHPAVKGMFKREGRGRDSKGGNITILNGIYLMDRLKSTRDILQRRTTGAVASVTE